MRAQEMRNKPTTKAQKRNTMSTYLKNMAGYKHHQLKNKSFDDIQKLFDKAIKRVNTFVDMDTELVEGSKVRAEGSEIRIEGSSKRAGEDLQQESIKKQKVDEDKETAELQRLIKVVPGKEEVAIDAITLETKPPRIVDYKIHKEGKKTYYLLIRADGSSKMYLVSSHMLKSFNMEDLETLWKLVKAKHGSTRTEEAYERVLWGDLKTMFDPHVEDQVWRNQQDYKVLDCKIYNSCGVYSLRKQNVHIHMLVEKRYPLTPAIITHMLNKKLQCDHFSEMLSMKKLEILKENIKFRGGLLGLKDFMMILKLLLLRTTKLGNDILMFQQHHGESLSEAWTRFKDLLQKVPYQGIDLWLQELHEDLALYENKSWNDPRDFAKPVKAISLPQDVPSTSDCHLIELENQVQRLMEADLAPKSPVQVNKITSSEICGGPYDTQYFMKNPELEDSKPFDTLANLGSCVNLVLLYLFKTLKIGLLEETKNVLGLADGTKSYLVGIVTNVELYIGKLKLLEDFYVIDMKLDLMCPLLVGRGFIATVSAVIDCKKAKIAVGERITETPFSRL
ncbi:MAK10-like protein [Tanacetum coccineum]|uniref:MAK10-like protein n=1 Tax=Tanacetum coccineum TaxID=301880 RepID=A0ABQ5FPZ0_9ASTR